jgi:CBS domain-containing protein
LDDVVDLLSACPAFVGVPRESLIRLAAGARIGHMAAVEQPVTPAFVVQRGGLLVRDADNRTVMSSPVHTAEPDVSCAAVARRMTRERISSIVVFAGDQLGIATDRDLRTRLVADGRSADTPIGQIATFPVCTVSARTPVLKRSS